MTPGDSTEDSSDNEITHINGGSDNPNGYDIQNGVIISIGDNVQIWLTPDSPDGAIQGDHVPECSDPSQIHYYDSNGNVNGSSGEHTDIFVVGDHTGGYYQQGDWANDHYDFRPVNNITGNQGVPEGEAGKDYIFVTGDSDNYNVTGVDHPQNHQNNTVDNVQITNNTTGSHPIGNANGIEGIVFGDGPSASLGGDTDVTHSVTLNLDVDLDSTDSNDHLSSITIDGLPEGAEFGGEYTSVTYDPENGTYTLTFDDDTTHYDGQVTVTLPEGQDSIGDVTIDVDSTVSDELDHHFTFDGDEGGQLVSDTDGASADTEHDTAAEAPVDDVATDDGQPAASDIAPVEIGEATPEVAAGDEQPDASDITDTVPDTAQTLIATEGADVHLIVDASSGGNAGDGSDNTVMHINGGSDDPNGYDVQNGVIIAIGDNVQIWLTPDSPDGTIRGDHVPESSNPNQIHYYDSNGNVNASSGQHTDIFVVGEHTGGYYQQGDWANDHYDFRPINNITGNQGVPEGSAGKDYIFVTGDSSNYNVSGVDHPDNHQNNSIDNLQITHSENGSHPIGNANGIEGVVFGDGPSPPLGGATDVTHDATLDLDIHLQSGDSSDHLTSITLTGLPEGAHFSGEYTDVSYDSDHGSYTLTFDDQTTHYEGQVSVELPEGQQSIGDVSLEVNSTTSEHHDTDFSFNAEDGAHFESGTGTDNSDDHPADDASDTDHAEAGSETADDHPQDDAQPDQQTDADNTTAQNVDTGSTEHEADSAADGGDHELSLLDTEDIYMDFGALAGDDAEAHDSDGGGGGGGGGKGHGHEQDHGQGNAYAYGHDKDHGQSDDHRSDHDQSGNQGKSDIAQQGHDADHADQSAHSLDQEQPLNFSDIIHDSDEHQDLASLIQGESPPAVPVDPKDGPEPHGHGAPVEGADDAGHGGGGHDDMDNLIAKPDSDGNT
ncbi:hypothetical protein [Citrobacter sp. RHB25-C09]|uniref:hypothetical protein n=1 Tax=Citrobacter sp. RHB25-C09 TaxID=2742624 RepID=UPI0015EFBED2|nr:hypothetical protein [Citrobacter sp. RHB25-C09]QMI05781.1 hypothetical protein HVY19_13285 [Citrobacter sp. RHB25-C09]